MSVVTNKKAYIYLYLQFLDRTLLLYQALKCCVWLFER